MTTEKEPTGIMVKLTSLANLALITEPGNYVVKALSNVTEANRIQALTKEKESAGFEKYIVSLQAATPDMLPRIKEVFNGKTEVPVEETKGCYLTTNLIVNERAPGMDLPMRGQDIKIVVDWVDVEDEHGNSKRLLRVKNTQVVAFKKANKLNIVDFFAAPPAQPQQSSGETLTQKSGKKVTA